MAMALTSVSESSLAGACLCLKSNGERITEFACKELKGPNECGIHCDSIGFGDHDFFDEENCSTLQKKVKRQVIVIPIPEIEITSDIIEIVDLVTGETIQQQYIPVSAFGDTNSSSATKTEMLESTQEDMQSLAGQGQTTRRVVELDATFGGGIDTFQVPDALGGGWNTTKDFSGDFKLQLVQHIGNPDLYDVFVTEVNSKTDDMKLGGVNTGSIKGTLNPNATNQGTYNDKSGDIVVSFSQYLTADAQPNKQMLTYTTYSGKCEDCLKGDKSLILSGDSLYVSPIE